MKGSRRYVLVEGHGEVEAMGNLLARMSQRLDDIVPWSKPLRWPNLHAWDTSQGGVRRGVEYVMRKGDAASLLVIRDADNGCPRELAPAMTERIRELSVPFPVAYVLLKPEYEVLFLPCLNHMAGKKLGGRSGLGAGIRWDAEHWESRRGVKEWLSGQFPRGKAYKPTVDQLPLTRMIDLDTLSRADVPCFGTLERALSFFAQGKMLGQTYP